MFLVYLVVGTVIAGGIGLGVIYAASGDKKTQRQGVMMLVGAVIAILIAASFRK